MPRVSGQNSFYNFNIKWNSSLTYSKHKIIIRILINIQQSIPHGENELDQSTQMSASRTFVVVQYPQIRHQANRSHVRRSHGFDLVDRLESLLRQQIVKVGYDFVQQPQAFDTLVVAIQLRVEFVIIRDGSEHYSYARVALVIEFLR